MNHHLMAAHQSFLGNLLLLERGQHAAARVYHKGLGNLS
jgi:hypothetical protein